MLSICSLLWASHLLTMPFKLQYNSSNPTEEARRIDCRLSDMLYIQTTDSIPTYLLLWLFGVLRRWIIHVQHLSQVTQKWRRCQTQTSGSDPVQLGTDSSLYPNHIRFTNSLARSHFWSTALWGLPQTSKELYSILKLRVGLFIFLQTLINSQDFWLILWTFKGDWETS